MKRDIRDRWVAKLRSNAYQQGQGTMCIALPGEPDKFCCLGVLMEIAVEDGISERITSDHGNDVRYIDSMVGYKHYNHKYSAAAYPHQYAKDWAGLEDGDVTVLSSMNDIQGKTFPQIATYIEEHL